MTCALCSKTALTKVGDTGYCGDHRAEANAAMKKMGDKKVGADRSINFYQRRGKA